MRLGLMATLSRVRFHKWHPDLCPDEQPGIVRECSFYANDPDTFKALQQGTQSVPGVRDAPANASCWRYWSPRCVPRRIPSLTKAACGEGSAS